MRIGLTGTRSTAQEEPQEETMTQIAYVNGRYAPLGEQSVSVEDRGFQFADGVYEVVAVFNGQMLDLDGHLTRLARSCRELSIAMPMSPAAMVSVMKEMLRRNRIREGILYQQVTRGVARRDHIFPMPGTAPSFIMTAKPFDFAGKAKLVTSGVEVHAQSDLRWGRCDIKTISLLPNVLAKQAAKAAGAYEAILVDNNIVTEGGSTNMWMVDENGIVITHPSGYNILSGIMRDTLMRIAAAAQIKIIERKFTLDEFKNSCEAFLTSTTAPCMPITAIDGAKIACGIPGPVTQRLAHLMWAEINRQTGYLLPEDIF
jgi:D-alanine transaminase